MAPDGSGLLILQGSLTDGEFAKLQAKHLKLYYERPIGGFEKRLDLTWQRVVVTGDAFGPELEKGRILSIGRQAVAVRSGGRTLLAVAKVAGFDRLAFGMPANPVPLLYQPNESTLEAATNLSLFSTRRFAPAKAWLPVWRYVFNWLGAPGAASRFAWRPEVHPAYERTGKLPGDAEQRAAKRAADWFLHGRLILSAADQSTYLHADKWPDRVGELPVAGGDGSFGIAEGYSSRILGDGSQPVRWYRRADCNAESALAIALAGDARIAANLADYIAFHSGADKLDPSKAAYGLIGWNDTGPGPSTFYGDDNARYILGLIGTAGALHESRWDDSILRCILANFRTTGVNGFRGDALGEPGLDRLGWRHFFNAETVNMAPHFEAYLWACELWAYARTGYEPLKQRAEKAIERTMKTGENAWTWTNGLQQERARMLLPLAWLVRVDDTPRHRAWLDQIATEVLAHQADCGAIQEEVGDLSHGIAGPPQSNEAYGTAETPLLQENGDPVADMLYTTNFAFLGLHEAAAATGNPAYSKAESRLADFLCRIQIRSATHRELDGAWFRAFDFGDWDYWASNADAGWGAWSIETGWSVSWIAAVLAMRAHRQSLWGIHSTFKANPAIVKEMMADRY